ncbi:MAG: exodeoxyribonuclease VII large subunit [Oscillospiraceae bacterium]|nr:exodeoxyribonuclease VII large subunit [Oscillospiraceae bacterium]
MSTVLSVTQINTYVKSLIDYDDKLKNIYISGEISNFTNHYRSGHFYFTLKDENCSIKAVMFRSAASRVRFEIENGMRVIIRGSVSVYERDGVYQLYVDDIAPDGEGALNLAFEQLKKKLSQAGMFDESHKKPIPKFPEHVGVITSETGAALHDIISVLTRRYPLAQIVFEPVQVQGDAAAGQISQAIKKLDDEKSCDVIIIGRGGGSIEDLWAFNEEIVANAVYYCNTPIISAVGHETDYTISDFVADLRAPTPSAAAELAVPDYREVLYSLDKTLDVLNDSINKIIADKLMRLMALDKTINALSPIKTLQLYSKQSQLFSQRLSHAVNMIFEKYNNEISRQALKLESYSPLNILSKGYSIACDKDGNTLESVRQVQPQDRIKLRVSDGLIECSVLTTEEMNKTTD